MAAQLIWCYYYMVKQIDPPIPGAADLLWVAQGVLFIFAICYLMSKNRNVYRGMRFVFDSLTWLVILTVVAWELIFRAVVQQFQLEDSLAGFVLMAVYQLSCLVFLCILLILSFAYRELLPRRAMRLLELSAVFLTLGNSGYLLMYIHDTYQFGGIYDLFMGAALLIMASAGLYALEPSPAVQQETGRDQRRCYYIRFIFPYACLTVLLLVELIRIQPKDSIIIGGGVIILLIIIRQIMVLLENRALMERLKTTLARAEFLANHDDLSGLPNRRFFAEQVAKGLKSLEKNGQQKRLLSVMFLDLDRFKYINDSYGHEVGDQFIQLIAARLVQLKDDRMTIARQGGDEFIILFTDAASQEEVSERAKQLIAAFNIPFQMEKGEIRTAVSIGVAVYPKDGRTPLELMKKADMALDKAKALGGNRRTFYSEEMVDAVTRKLAVELALRHALEQEEFQLYYQPQIRSCDGKLVGVEALIRWRTGEGELVSPGEFIPLAEETGLIVPIGEWVIRTACCQAVSWQCGGKADFQMSVNVSPRQFQEPDFVHRVSAILEETKLSPECLVLEITEGISIQEEERTVAMLTALKEIGVQISMDDFGTGYSSLSYLHRFQVDSLKIAQSFIGGIFNSSSQAAIVKAILAMAGSLNLKVIAEGVETKEQFEFLQANGCDWIQGYYFYRPLTKEQVERLL
ncbi:hypothetical protein GCM10010911_60070 [Paenibacillus nasutitermitis]|uniref:Diguanylate cyclase (GGDEF) domain-containing protein n=2 Tax=Paenibacillus nasutitermitis TaxID=1652958 RepID=A0A917E127_9BACL|nr:hypothetical protein GCM10010911_60070 [Paenibacillus nasutitermitis]